MSEKNQFPSNSLNLGVQPQPEQKQTPPTPRSVAPGTIRKKSLGDKFADAFFYADIKTVVHDVIHEAVLPDLQTGLMNVLSTCFYHAPYRGPYQSAARPVQQPGIDYHATQQRAAQPSVVVSPGARVPIKNIVFQSLEDADAVRNQLIEYATRYNAVSVQMYYTFSSITTDDYTTAKYGWRKDEIVQTAIMANADGTFSLKLPRPVQIR